MPDQIMMLPGPLAGFLKSLQSFARNRAIVPGFLKGFYLPIRHLVRTGDRGNNETGDVGKD